MSTLTIARLNAPWVAECEACGAQYLDHAGSTPCCGSIAFIVNDPAALARLQQGPDAPNPNGLGQTMLRLIKEHIAENPDATYPTH
jgi:hypothetical protein